jgi:hypothetical protein
MGRSWVDRVDPGKQRQLTTHGTDGRSCPDLPHSQLLSLDFGTTSGGGRMAATTVTTIVMIIFGSALIGVGLRNLFGNWEPIVKRTPEQIREAEVQRAVRRLRAQIDRYESDRWSR